jgi:hypothetical protein
MGEVCGMDTVGKFLAHSVDLLYGDKVSSGVEGV